MKHVTSRKAHGEWERGGKGETDDSPYTKGAERQHYSRKTFFLASARISKEDWQVGFHPKPVVCMVSLRNCSDCCDTGRGF